MLPTQALRLQIGTALAGTTPLDQATALNRVALISAPFTPNENLTFADLTLATFDGSTEKTVPLGSQEVGVDPLTGQQIITIVPPAGGWRFVSTGVTNLPQTIYGFCLYDSTGPGPLLACELLPTPISIVASGQQIDLGTVKLTLVLSPMS